MGDGGLRYNLKKVAILAASGNGESVVSLSCMLAAVRFMEWQVEIRKVFRSGQAKTLEAEFDAMVMDKVRRKCQKTGDYIKLSRLVHDLKWNSDRSRYGASNVLRWLDALKKSGTLRCRLLRTKEGAIMKDENGVPIRTKTP